MHKTGLPAGIVVGAQGEGPYLQTRAAARADNRAYTRACAAALGIHAHWGPARVVKSAAPCRAPPAPISTDLPAGGVGSLRPSAELFEEPEREEGHHVKPQIRRQQADP